MDLRSAMLRQARSDFEVFDRLIEDADLPDCHWLHYLQMSTEKFAKAVLTRGTKDTGLHSHAAFSKLTSVLRRHHEAARVLGVSTRQLEHFVRITAGLRTQIERLQPQLAGTGPNAEYPWQAPPWASETWIAPADYNFPIGNDMRGDYGVRLRRFIQVLLREFEQVF